jgi:hypothetical protein
MQRRISRSTDLLTLDPAITYLDMPNSNGTIRNIN